MKSLESQSFINFKDPEHIIPPSPRDNIPHSVGVLGETINELGKF